MLARFLVSVVPCRYLKMNALWKHSCCHDADHKKKNILHNFKRKMWKHAATTQIRKNASREIRKRGQQIRKKADAS